MLANKLGEDLAILTEEEEDRVQMIQGEIDHLEEEETRRTIQTIQEVEVEVETRHTIPEGEEVEVEEILTTRMIHPEEMMIPQEDQEGGKATETWTLTVRTQQGFTRDRDRFSKAPEAKVPSAITRTVIQTEIRTIALV